MFLGEKVYILHILGLYYRKLFDEYFLVTIMGFLKRLYFLFEKRGYSDKSFEYSSHSISYTKNLT